MGSPTVNNSILPTVAGFLYMMKERKFKNKKAASFGCYGWSGEAVKTMNELLVSAGFDLADDGFKNMWNPDKEKQEEAVDFGRKIAKV